MKYRKKGQGIEAHRYDGVFENIPKCFFEHRAFTPEIINDDELVISDGVVCTRVHKGDWILIDDKMSMYPVKNKYFVDNYEAI